MNTVLSKRNLGGPSRRVATLVTGPTASGKSALALTLAERLNGTIINADSMQLYAELRILTARPSPADESRVPHALYGIRPAAEPANAAWWRTQALAAIEAAHDVGRLPIVCGGTGLYLQALTNGIALIPDPGEPARAEARALLAEIGPAALHARLAQADPATAATLRPSDSQRLARAWEVWRGTGQGLAAWHAIPRTPPPWPVRAIVLDPPRPALREAIAARFHAMLDHGALDEVRALLALNLDPAVPLLRALGVPDLARHLRGEATLAEATAQAILSSGQYVKRQATWFRNRGIAAPCDTHTIHAGYWPETQLSESIMAEIQSFISRTS